ncbi:unnamed protein product [Protopolystoma xenopodis]|uniref:Uncharacterized protein n=1 Tax=Protopolystoma xenopodis TaxID=117903 RepID=A0A3S5B2C7_9PLAT|nr:unnamed protein product [Protopolystoma xenopodis]
MHWCEDKVWRAAVESVGGGMNECVNGTVLDKDVLIGELVNISDWTVGEEAIGEEDHDGSKVLWSGAKVEPADPVQHASQIDLVPQSCPNDSDNASSRRYARRPLRAAPQFPLQDRATERSIRAFVPAHFSCERTKGHWKTRIYSIFPILTLRLNSPQTCASLVLTALALFNRPVPPEILDSIRARSQTRLKALDSTVVVDTEWTRARLERDPRTDESETHFAFSL